MKQFLVMLGIVISTTVVPAQNRDLPSVRPAPSTISGVVTDDMRQPVGRVVVRLEGERFLRTVITAADGKFAFAPLPAGRYTLSASKPAYLKTQYGAKRPGRSGTALVLAPGDSLTNLSLVLPRGAVVTGRILNPQGEGAADMTVRVLASRFGATGRSFVNVTETTSDDRGMYRIYGLEPGDYLVSAMPRVDGPAVPVISQAEVDRAMRDVRQVPLALLSPAQTQQRQDLAASASTERPAAYVPMYYPGTAAIGDATVVTLGIGDVREGVDFGVRLLPTVKIEGTVSRADGQPLSGFQVTLVPATSDSTRSFGVAGQSNGSFVFNSVVPGDYIVMAGLVARPNAPVPREATTAIARLTATTDISGLILTLRPGLNLSGRTVLRSDQPNPAPPGSFSVMLNPIGVGNWNVLRLMARAARADASGDFEMTSVAPGRYLINVALQSGGGPRGRRWMPSSIVVNGREVIDGGLEITGDERALEAVVTFTDRIAELTGTFVDASGQPAPDYTIILFSTDRAAWGWESRRIKTVRPSSDGKFVFSDLPAGDYFLTALTDVETNEYFDPTFLEPLLSSSIKVTIGEGEKKVQDIRIR